MNDAALIQFDVIVITVTFVKECETMVKPILVKCICKTWASHARLLCSR